MITVLDAHRRVIAMCAALALCAAGAATAMAAPPATGTPTNSQAASPAAALPGDSIYQLPLTLTNQQGQGFALNSRRGSPVIVGMFYTSCQFVCPMLIDAIRATQQKLTPAERERLDVLLVSFDPARDTVAVLRKTADARQLDPTHWTLARTDAASVRKFAAMLDIQYKPTGDGDFNHSTVLVLLDADGRIVARTSELGVADPAFVQAVKAATAAAASKRRTALP